MSNEYNEIICTVCLDSLKKKSHHSIIPKYTPSIISLSCSHTYHFKCIISWFTKSYSFLCPVCKNPDKVLLENFLPEIKNALHKEILENKCDYHTQEEYEEYCENCIKQGNMLKIIDLQQINLNFTTPTTETDIDNDNEIMERNIYSSSSLRNRYIFDDEDEDDEEQEQEQENEEIEIEKDEMIAYARVLLLLSLL
ncbi:hypothetical protein H8356DRAFT_1302170 [Neocallimastix lanati (nom. inval.)]|uniref:RING-type domain-containing protein n=1 Tax=Neocallimastix californiae TaxID=1754190 RepID=A0A1Y2DM79_9FUNG|nr:hypothetical protein H8356DRAFT_1302170 [Neocallimastix sp. JGI-2020a]ORY60418.1 hypothetical protein LY90DRAFT_668627 [Neocallimastix californiae]|eukprot:ORY60418.1 hypothetical protein LY90DRAFT_668627 [Neocallimastix californiae]